MKKRLTAVLTAVFIILSAFGSVCAADNAFAVSVEPQNERVGNAYYEGEAPSFSIVLQNNLGSSVDVTLSLAVADEAGVVAASESRTVKVSGRQTKLVGYNPGLENKFGAYTISATMSNSVHTATSELKFSYTEKHHTNLDDLGFSCHFTKPAENYAKADKSGEILRESGAGWIRDEINWSSFETVKGKYVVPQRYEDMVNRAIASGKKVMLLVTGGNSLYETGKGPNGEAIPCLPVTPSGIEGFANFAAFVAEHFKGRVDTFEIWNEPDWTDFNGHYDWLPGDTTAGWTNLADKSSAAYANLIKAVYPAIKNVYKGEEDKVTVVSGGCLPIQSDTGYLYKMLSVDGVQDCIDAVGVHTYSVDATFGDMCSGNSRDFTKQLRRVKNYTSKPIYITEYGASSFGNSENGGSDGVSAFKGYGIYGSNGQAMALVRAYMVVANDPQIERLFVYNFKEKGSTPNIEANFGVVGYDYTPKRAYAALSAMSSIMANAETTKPIEANETNYAFGDRAKIYEFADKKTGDDIFVVAAGGSAYEWGTTLSITQNVNPTSGRTTAALDNANKSVTIDTYSGGTVNVFDIMGNEIQPESSGIYRIYLAPMYVVCSKPEPGITVNGSTVKVKGSTTKAYGDVTALVTKKNSVGQSLVFIDELTADKYGRYEFSFEKTEGDIYSIRAYDGRAYINDRYDLDKYDIDIRYYADGVEIFDASDIKPGSTLKMEMEIVDKMKTGDKLIAIGSIYGDNEIMLEADSAGIVWNDNKAVLTTEINVSESSDIGSLKFMLWDENMKPVLNKIIGN